MTIHFACPTCKKTVQAADDKAGTYVDCPGCKAFIPVPSSQAKPANTASIEKDTATRDWYYAKDGQRVGPVSSAELQALAASGGLQPSDMVWKQGMAQWSPVGASLLPPPLPASLPSLSMGGRADRGEETDSPRRRRERGDLDEDESPGRDTGTKKKKLWFLLGGGGAIFLIVCGVFGLFWRNGKEGEPRRNAKLTFNGGSVFYTSEVSKEQAEKLGHFLAKVNAFDGSPKTVYLNKPGSIYEFRIVVTKGIEHDEGVRQSLILFGVPGRFFDPAGLYQFGKMLSENVFDSAPVDVHVCDEHLNTRYLWPTPVNIITKNNCAKICPGMNEAEVESILGKFADVDIPTGRPEWSPADKTMIWQERGCNCINVHFLDGKVKQTSLWWVHD